MKPGYKQTEVGVIPEDWEVKPLKLVSPLQRGFDLPYLNIISGEYPVIFSNGVGIFHNKYKVKGPGVVTGRSGTIGRVCYIEDNFWPHNTTLWVTDFKDNHSKFIYYLFETINWSSYNSGSGVPTLNRNDVHGLLLACPPNEEQKKIAEALSDVDELIFSLEELIAKKKNIKKGAMQQLLTGKKRLPGFTGEWKEIKLGQAGDIIRKSIDPQKFSSKIFREYSMPAFDTGKKPNVVTGSSMHSSRILISGEVLLFNKLNVRQKRVWFINHCEKHALCSSEFLPYVSTQISLPLLSYYLLTDEATSDFEGMSTGTSNSQKRITPKKFREYSLLVPSTKQEQDAIANTLSDMDGEIDALEQKLAKTRQLKQGMMQQLLTGKIRLI